MDFDGDDAMVGAEELQLLQQMSQQMMQVYKTWSVFCAYLCLQFFFKCRRKRKSSSGGSVSNSSTNHNNSFPPAREASLSTASLSCKVTVHWFLQAVAAPVE
jgi:hypothetical protein